jgi:hypothetical protein
VSLLVTLLAQARLGGSGRPDIHVSPRAFVAVLVAGFLVAIAGHVVQSRPLVAFGIALIFGATVLVPALLVFAG